MINRPTMLRNSGNSAKVCCCRINVAVKNNVLLMASVMGQRNERASQLYASAKIINEKPPDSVPRMVAVA